MSERLREFVDRNGARDTLLLVLVLLAYHLVAILAAPPAVDLALRLQESRYLLAGIDPYLVMIGDVEPLPHLGGTTAYAFVSYLFVLPLLLIGSTQAQELIYATVELALLAVSLRLLSKIPGVATRRMMLASGAGLIGSVFFLQHVWNLNYAIIAASAVVFVFASDWMGRRWMGVVGLVLLGLKPSFAIPVVIVLLVRRDWRILLPGGLILSALLGLVSIRLSRNPIDVLLSTASTAERYTSGYENGLLFPVWSLVESLALPLGVAACLLVAYLLRRQIADPVVAMSLSLWLGMSLFYNHVHAWTAVVPVLGLAAGWSRISQDARRAAGFLLAFLLVPRLLGVVPLELRDAYVAIHNIGRFSVLGVGVWLASRAALAQSNGNLRVAGSS